MVLKQITREFQTQLNKNYTEIYGINNTITKLNLMDILF